MARVLEDSILDMKSSSFGASLRYRNSFFFFADSQSTMLATGKYT
jgi:hypothetical protein